MNRAVLALALVAACGGDDPANRAPTANPLTLTTAEDTAVTETADASDLDSDTLAASVATAPAHGDVTTNGLSITYTPDADYHGPDQFTLSVSDGTLSTSLTVDVTVTAVNDAPVGAADSIQTNEDTARTVPVDQFLSNDSDVDGDTLMIKSVTAGAHGGVVLADGNITYTPEANFNGGDAFTYTITDGTVDVVVDVEVVVGVANDTPIAVDDSVTTTEDTAITIPSTTLLANDNDPDGDTLTISAVSGAQGGTVSLNGGNPIFTPAANSTTAGSFVYTVSDGTSSDQATVTVNITAVNDGPDAVNDTATTDEDTAVVVSVLANDTDPDGTTPTLQAIVSSTNGTAVANTGNGTVGFTPNANFHGTATFTYSITDGTLTDTATVTVTVNAVNDAPVAVDDSGSTDPATPITFSNLTANDTDVDIATDGQTLTVTAVANAVNGTVSLNGGSPIFTPTSTETGSFEYTVSDGNGGTDTGLVTITINQANVNPPTAGADSVTQTSTTTAYPHSTFLANDTDGGDGGALVITAVGNATNGTVTLEATTITFTPDAGFAGTAGFEYTLSDGGAVTATGVVTVTVTANPCGNGTIDVGEECDTSGASATCSATCTLLEGCGDGNIDAGEQCDDDNIANGDGCSATCQFETLCSFSFTGAAGDEATFAADVAIGITAPIMSRGSGVAGNAAANAFSSTGWSTGAVILAADFYTFTVTPSANGSVSLVQLKFDERRSSTGIRNWALRSSLDGFAANIAAASVPDDTATRTQTVTLPAAFLNVSTPIEFRLFGFGSEAEAGTWRIDNVIVSGAATSP